MGNLRVLAPPNRHCYHCENSTYNKAHLDRGEVLSTRPQRRSRVETRFFSEASNAPASEYLARASGAISSVSQIGVDLLRVPLYSAGIPEGTKFVGICWVPGPSAEKNRTTAHKGHQILPSRCSREEAVSSVCTSLVNVSFPRTSYVVTLVGRARGW